MRRISFFGMTTLLTVFLFASVNAFDGNRKGVVLGGGYGFVPAGPHYVLQNTTKYTQGMSFRFMLGYGFNARSMLTFSRVTMGTLQNYTYEGKDQLSWEAPNAGWELAYTRYRRDTHRSMFWRAGLGFLDWGYWGSLTDRRIDKPHQWNVALLAGAGYEVWRGCQLQLDLFTGPGPSDADKSLKALVRLELVGIIY